MISLIISMGFPLSFGLALYFLASLDSKSGVSSRFYMPQERDVSESNVIYLNGRH